MSTPERTEQRQRRAVAEIDDETAIRESLDTLLTLEGFAVSTAEDGPAGLELLSRNEYDLLLLDLYLPKRDGNEILKHLRASERCAQTPVVILTSSDAPSDHENAEKNAAIHYFRKPSSLGKLLKLGIIIKVVIGGAEAS